MLFVLNNLGVGGSETKIVRMANSLMRSGVDAKIAYLNGPETLIDSIDQTVSVTPLERRGKYSTKALRRLCELVREEQDLILAVNLYPLLYVIPASKWLVPCRAKVAALINTSRTVGREKVLERIYTPFLKRCDWTIFGCHTQEQEWIERHGLEQRRSKVIYNGVDCTWYRPGEASQAGNLLRRRLQIPDSAFIVGSVGRLHAEKSFDLLIKAAARLNRSGRDCYIVITGAGEQLSQLQRLAEEECIEDKLKLTGLLRDVREAVSIMDVFVLPSSAVETFSNAALEAMAMAKPVVLSDIGGASEMIRDGSSGKLFPVGDGEGLMKILANLYDLPDARNSMGSAARQQVLDHFQFSRMLDEYIALIHG